MIRQLKVEEVEGLSIVCIYLFLIIIEQIQKKYLSIWKNRQNQGQHI